MRSFQIGIVGLSALIYQLPIFGWNIQATQTRENVDFRDPRFASIGLLSDQCTATLIGPDLVLTAAHCMNYGPFKLRATFANKNGGEAKITKIVATGDYPKNGTRSNPNDWAILKLDRKVSNTWVSIASAPPREGSTLLAVGYSGDKNEGLHPVVDKSCLMGAEEQKNYIKFKRCEWMPGASGGPFLSCSSNKCELAGIISGHSSNTSDNFGVSSAAFYSAVQDLSIPEPESSYPRHANTPPESHNETPPRAAGGNGRDIQKELQALLPAHTPQRELTPSRDTQKELQALLPARTPQRERTPSRDTQKELQALLPARNPQRGPTPKRDISNELREMLGR